VYLVVDWYKCRELSAVYCIVVNVQCDTENGCWNDTGCCVIHHFWRLADIH